MADNILVFDIGLTNCKTALFSAQGVLLERAAVPYPTYNPQPGWVEQQAEDWWQAIRTGVGLVRERNPQAIEAVCAISVTGHMHALVCLGEDGRALGPVLVLGDQRSLAAAEQIADQAGTQHVYQVTGARLDASTPLAKLCWLREQAPEIHHKSRAFLACKDWVRHQLTGDLLTDPIDACGTSYYDLRQNRWSDELVALAGVRASQLPEIADPISIAGKLQAAAAQTLGLKAGIPVVVGAGDDVEVLGNGLMNPGAASEHLGTTGSILTCTPQLVFDPEMAVEVYPHVAPGLWVLGGSVTAAGLVYTWVQEVLNHSAGDGWMPPASRPNLGQPLIFVPHLSGERCPSWEPRARGSWLGLSAAHTARDLHQAALEGVAFSLKRVLDRIEELVGRQERIMVSGREGQNEGWLNLRANLYHRPLHILNTDEPTALGAMTLAAAGVGLYADLAAAVEQVNGSVGVIEPDPVASHEYERLYRLYLGSEEALRPLMRQWDASR